LRLSRRAEFIIGFLVGIGAPIFSIAIALDNFPVLKEIGDVANPAWNLVVMRAISFGVIINAVLFFATVNQGRDSVSKGILASCVPSIAAVVYFQFIL
jgi:divalent metal cation (Fe/Co/Zn/Cd) transporter